MSLTRVKEWAAETLTYQDLNAEFDNVISAIGTEIQAFDAGLLAIAGLAVADSNFIVGNGSTWITETGATARASMGVVIGTNVQAWDADLDALAGLASAADKLPYFTGSETASVTNLTAAARTILDDATVAAILTTIGGTNTSHDHSGGANGPGITSGGLALNAVTTTKITDLNVTEAKLAASSVSSGKLKLSSTDTNWGPTAANLPIATAGTPYSFYPQVKDSTNVSLHIAEILNAGGTYITTLFLNHNSVSQTTNIAQAFITSCPPHKIGDIVWGQFLFCIRNISTKQIIGSWTSQEPPWGEGRIKNSFENIIRVPHPFSEYWHKDPKDEGLEICCINLSHKNVENWKNREANFGKSILEDLKNVIDPRKIISRESIGLPHIPGFTDKVKMYKG